jgi:hypothetical protein
MRKPIKNGHCNDKLMDGVNFPFFNFKFFNNQKSLLLIVLVEKAAICNISALQ